ncbi:CASTOR/POLLUX-related putative ion channel [Aquihabitans sp. McL0605]|uniref:CASTOR/POLLUX-related putative ion channel n=1 Tax=Aquihabitans sp. McL0605 TaxID=3415671 RepID=UPI003CFAA7CE
MAQVQDRIDRALVRGQINVIVWLGGAALLLALTAALVETMLHLAVHGHAPSFPEAFWQSLVRTIDPGQITDDHAGFAIVGLVITIIGLLLITTLISLVNNRIERRVEGIRRGRDPIPPRADHIVLLGWSDIGSKVIEEFAESGISSELVDMVVLANHSVADMRHELQENDDLGPRGAHWPVLRSGTTWDTRDLRRLASIATSRAVVILDDNTTDGLANTVKTVMAIVAACDGPSHDRQAHEHPTIVIEVLGETNDLVDPLRRRLARFGFRIVTVDSLALRTELAAQVSRRAGLSQVFQEILNFSGEELYLMEAPPEVATFGQAVTALRDRVSIGTIDAAGGQVNLWPHWATPLAGSSLILIASNEAAAASTDGIDMAAPPLEGGRPSCCERPLETQHLLVVGWNSGAVHLLEVLDQYAGEGSSVTVVTSDPVEPGPLKLESFGDQRFICPTIGVQAWLDLERDHFDHAIVLADDAVSPAASDASAFVTLLSLRPAGDIHGNPTTVVAQLRQRENKHLARQSLADDLVVGDAVTATTLAQLAMNPDLEHVLHDILGDTPYTIELVANPYLGRTSSVSFEQITTAIALHGEIALGWIKTDGTLKLSPHKDERIAHTDLQQIVVFTRLRRTS